MLAWLAWLACCSSIQNVGYANHTFRYTADNESAVAAALHAGCDFECGGTFSSYLVKSLDRGDLSIADLQRAARRMLKPAFQMGLLDPVDRQLPFLQLSARDVDTPVNRKLSFDASVQAAVLLVNRPVSHLGSGATASPLLPLQTGALLRRIAVMGPIANATQTLLANYHGVNSLVEQQSVLSALQRRAVQGGFEVAFEAGCRSIACTDASSFGEAATLARSADVAIVVVGLCSDDCDGGASDAAAREGEGTDRKSTDLPGLQEQLVREIVMTGTPTIVLIIHGGALSVDWIAANVPAVLSLHYPGELGGDAAVALMFGDVSPSGRNTVTWYSSTFQAERPLITDMQLASHTSAQGAYVPGITYLYYNSSVLWPFGFGLSYTEFEFAWSDHQGVAPRSVLSVSQFLARPPSFSVNVTNIGARVSDVSAMAFVASGLAGEPLRECFDFARASMLSPAASVVLTFTLPPWVAATVDKDGSQVLTRGEYTVSVHGGSGGTKPVLTMDLVVVGDADAILFDMRAVRHQRAQAP